jgi:hypothetical protein
MPCKRVGSGYGSVGRPVIVCPPHADAGTDPAITIATTAYAISPVRHNAGRAAAIRSWF